MVLREVTLLAVIVRILCAALFGGLLGASSFVNGVVIPVDGGFSAYSGV